MYIRSLRYNTTALLLILTANDKFNLSCHAGHDTPSFFQKGLVKTALLCTPDRG